MDTVSQVDVSPASAISAATTERRSSKRVAHCASVGFLSDTNFFTGFTEDISEGGLFIASHMLEPIGTEMTLTFTLPSCHEVTVQGVVCWLRDPHDTESSHPGMGVRFVGLSDADAAAIQGFLKLREPLFYEA